MTAGDIADGISHGDDDKTKGKGSTNQPGDSRGAYLPRNTAGDQHKDAGADELCQILPQFFHVLLLLLFLFVVESTGIIAQDDVFYKKKEKRQGRNAVFPDGLQKRPVPLCLHAISDKIHSDTSEARGFRNSVLLGRERRMALLFFLFWMVLNGKVTWETAAFGAAVCALAMTFACRACGWSLDREKRLYAAAPRIIGYLGVLLWEILKANLKTFRTVWGRGPDPVVRTIRTGLVTRMGKMALANSITLTPGTITLDCRGNELTVHCLTAEMAEGLDENIFEAKLKRIEAVLHG